MVISERGIVATSQTLASQAGAQVLARGGTAMDAAIAANAVLGVVEPMSNGIGGDLFAIYYDAKSGTLSGINASGWAPQGLSLDLLKRRGLSSMPSTGILSVTVPGCVDGWERLHGRFGRLPWAELFKPAVYFAANGFPVTEIIQGEWRSALSTLSKDPGARGTMLIDGKVPHVGQIFRNPDLAKALELVATKGAEAFYRGPIADAILTASERLDGVLNAEDLAEFESEWVEPISTTYRGWTVYELPPNGQGMAALEMLNIMETLPLQKSSHLGVEALHAKIEAQKLAYQDLLRYNGDPRFSKIPLGGLLSKAYAAERASLIDPKAARCEVEPGNPPEGTGDTIYLAVVDKDGNIASLIQSVYERFGSGVMVDGMGFHLQNRGALFETAPEHPNALAPRKRPFHTIIPAFMEKDGVRIGFGIMGGFNQAQAHAQFVSNLVDHGLNLQAALEAPRFTKLDFEGCGVSIEGRVSSQVRRALRAKGHKLDVRADYASQMGGGQAVAHHDKMLINWAASSPRKDGAAVPEPDPYFSTEKDANK